ncbi:MAG: hypothetical protein JNN30_12365 [Rhodanobacteraceae bacterium]|nr:hypothetical protein [Rhodanobacteraceae bacterium]
MKASYLRAAALCAICCIAGAAQAAETTLLFNRGALAPLGIEVLDECGGCVAQRERADYREQRYAAVDAASLRWSGRPGRFGALLAGAVRHQGGPRLRLSSGERLDLAGFQLRRRGSARMGLELADAAGEVWFQLDHAHAYVAEDGALSLQHMDMRVSEVLAQRLGRPQWTGVLVGGVQTEGLAAASADMASKAAGACPLQWPSVAAQADVEMLRLALNWEERQPDGVNFYRCGRSDGLGGHSRACSADSEDGLVVLAPDASLRNAGSAAVAWYAKFSPPAPPYANDQHPFLVWNLYRLDADGQLVQIAASAAKHAFHTINAVCDCAQGHVLFPGCEDTYGGFSNDYPSGLAPRSEIIPYTAQWGRCGSLYDKDCDGLRDSDEGLLPDDAYNRAKRLAVRESELLPSRHVGARWFLEYWYVVRDDANPWNNIGLMQIEPQKVRGQGLDPNAYVWRFEVNDFRRGSMLDRWLDMAPAGAWQRRSLVSTPQGRALLATRVTRRGDGRYAYAYMVFNLDLTLTRTSGQEPNLRVEQNLGVERFAVFTDPQALIEAQDFAAVADTGTSWSVARDNTRVAWTRGSSTPLGWGLTFRFGFVSDFAPRDSKAHLGAAESIWHAATFAPLRDWEPVSRPRPAANAADLSSTVGARAE